MLKLCVNACLVLCLSAGSAPTQESPTFVPLDVDTYASGISADGSIVIGNYYPPSGKSGGFYWTTDTGTVNIGGNGVAGISADGTTIVGQANDAMGHENAAIWQGGTD